MIVLVTLLKSSSCQPTPTSDGSRSKWPSQALYAGAKIHSRQILRGTRPPCMQTPPQLLSVSLFSLHLYCLDFYGLQFPPLDDTFKKAAPMKYQQHGCLNKAWTMTIPVDMLIWMQLVTAERGRTGLFQGSPAPPISYPLPKSQPWKHTHILNGLNKLYLYIYVYIYTHKTIIIYKNNKEKKIMNLRGRRGQKWCNHSIHIWYLINLLKRKREFYTCITKDFFLFLRILLKYF